jgi:GNAT superfamily N-acetyltransferase
VIRPATIDDRLAVVALLKDSRAGAGFDRADGPTGFVFPFVAAYAERLVLAHLGDPACCCLLLEAEGAPRGVLMARAAEHPFGPVRVATETLWWIDPAFRGRSALAMLAAYEDWARAQGCAFAGMAGMGPDPQVGALYRRRGYRPAETHFLKPL